MQCNAVQCVLAGSSRDVGEWLGRAREGQQGAEEVCRGMDRWEAG